MKKKVLIVEDEEGLCQFMKELFERKGLEALVFTDSGKAWEAFKKEKPQACILDIHMPFSEFDGLELLRRIRKIDQDTRCAMITRIGDKEKIEEAQKLGAYKYIFKPASLEDMKKLVEEISS